MNPLVIFALLFAAIFFLYHLISSFYHIHQFFKIRSFYANILDISDTQLRNVGWSNIVQRLCGAQKRLHIVVNQDVITPLDVYQRILRHQNYFTGMISSEVLSFKLQVPFVGDIHYLPRGLYLNLKWLFFWLPCSPWKSSYAIKDEYKNLASLKYLSNQMSRTIMWISLINLILSPFFLIYQILFSFFSYSDMFRRDPNVFGMRKYSNYGREKLRHYNELDSELDSRLNRSYKFASRYMDQFVSPLCEVHAKFIAFIAAAICTVLIVLSAWDEDVLNIEHVLTVISVSGVIVLACRTFISGENAVFCQDFLMQQIISNIHYAPKTWIKNAHSDEVYGEFSQLFKLKIQCLMEDLASPLLTPYILYFKIRKRASEFVLFFHNNTRYIEGLGDVCTFAQMDLTRDGDACLAATLNQSFPDSSYGAPLKSSTNKLAGKTELSLLNFTKQNPKWVPNKNGKDFIDKVKKMVDECQLNMSSTIVDAGGLAFPGALLGITSSQMHHGGQTTSDSFHHSQTYAEDESLRAAEMSMAALVLNYALLTSTPKQNPDRSNSLVDNIRAKMSPSSFSKGNRNGSRDMALENSRLFNNNDFSPSIDTSQQLPSFTTTIQQDRMPNNESSDKIVWNSLTARNVHYGTMMDGTGTCSTTFETSNLWGVPRNTELSQINIAQSILEEDNEDFFWLYCINRFFSTIFGSSYLATSFYVRFSDEN